MLTHVNGTVTIIDLKSQRDQKHGEKLKQKNTANFPSDVTHLPRWRIVRKVFHIFSFHQTQMEDYDTKPEVCLSGEECNDHFYVCRENG